MKPRIFIGSSTEGLKTATYIKKKLRGKFDCYLWTDNIFKPNESTLERLLKGASLFDFGILVVTKDDYLVTRGKEFKTARDNVIFEFGLFLGRLGPSRSFIIQEGGTKLPSDLLGTTIPQMKGINSPKNSKSLNSEIKKIKNLIGEKFKQGELGLLPSTALAIGYFNNFIKIVCDYLHNEKSIVIGGRKFTKFQLHIVMPKSLDNETKKRAALFFTKKKLKQITLTPPGSGGRFFPVHSAYDRGQKSILKIYDMPTTLSGINTAIEMYLKKAHIGKDHEQELLEYRELQNFERVLKNLIEGDAYCKKYTKISFDSH
jgi:hypothetical protein